MSPKRKKYALTKHLTTFLTYRPEYLKVYVDRLTVIKGIIRFTVFDIGPPISQLPEVIIHGSR